MYPNPYHSERPYTGQADAGPYHCPVCGSTGECLGVVAVPLLHPPFDIDGEPESGGGPLRPYTVTVRGFSTTMRLNDADAARYGSAAVAIP